MIFWAKSETMGTHVKPSFSGVFITHVFSRDGNWKPSFFYGKTWGPREAVFSQNPTWTPKIPQSSKGTFFSKRFLGSIFIPLCPFYGPFEFIVDVFLGVISTKRLHSFGLMES